MALRRLPDCLRLGATSRQQELNDRMTPKPARPVKWCPALLIFCGQICPLICQSREHVETAHRCSYVSSHCSPGRRRGCGVEERLPALSPFLSVMDGALGTKRTAKSLAWLHTLALADAAGVPPASACSILPDLLAWQVMKARQWINERQMLVTESPIHFMLYKLLCH